MKVGDLVRFKFGGKVGIVVNVERYYDAIIFDMWVDEVTVHYDGNCYHQVKHPHWNTLEVINESR